MRSEQQTSWWGLRVGFLSLVLVGAAVGQSDRGTLAGTILDSSGAVVSGAIG